MALTIYRDTYSSQNLFLSVSVRYAKRLNLLKCACFDRLQAAVILIKPTIKLRKANYCEKILLFEQKSAWSRFALVLFKLHEI